MVKISHMQAEQNNKVSLSHCDSQSEPCFRENPYKVYSALTVCESLTRIVLFKSRAKLAFLNTKSNTQDAVKPR